MGNSLEVPASGSSLRFSTQALASAERLPALQAFFEARVQLAVDASPGAVVETRVEQLPGVRRVQMLSPMTARMTRTRSMLADGEDSVCLMLKTRGHMTLSQGAATVTPETGDGVLLVYREPAALQMVDASYIALRVPSQALPIGKDIGAVAARIIPRHTQALVLLKSYVEGWPRGITDPLLIRLYVSHIQDLMCVAIGASAEATQIVMHGGVRAARREAIKRALARNPTVSLDSVAASQGVSPRYVQMLFDDIGTTFSHYAQSQRLETARKMLLSPRYRTRTITDIALEAGFGDISHFNRCFKRHYQQTPSELRAESA